MLLVLDYTRIRLNYHRLQQEGKHLLYSLLFLRGESVEVIGLPTDEQLQPVNDELEGPIVDLGLAAVLVFVKQVLLDFFP